MNEKILVNIDGILCSSDFSNEEKLKEIDKIVNEALSD